jgi:hypothetical protein
MASFIGESKPKDVIKAHAIDDLIEAETLLKRAHDRLKKINHLKAPNLHNYMIEIEQIREILQECE